MTELETLNLRLQTLQADLKDLESDTPRLEGMVSAAYDAVLSARAAFKAGQGEADPLTLATGKHSALEGLLSEHQGEVNTLRARVSKLEGEALALEREEQRQARLAHLHRAHSHLEREQAVTLEALRQQVNTTVETFARTEKALNLAQREITQLEGGPGVDLRSVHPQEQALYTVIRAIEWHPIQNQVRSIWGAQEREIRAMLEKGGFEPKGL